MQNALHHMPITGSGIYEYAFIPVPQSHRKKSSGVFFVLTGYTSALSCLVLGARLGASMPFWQAIGSCFFGDLVLILMGTGMGILSSRTGWSTTFLARKVLGKNSSMIFSLFIICCSVFWIGLNGKMFSNIWISVFPNWPLPVAVTSLIIIGIWALSAANGWHGLEIASRIVVPCSLILLCITMFLLAKKMGTISFLFADTTNQPMSFAVASAAVIGNYVFGCMITPDTCRFATSDRSVISVCPFAYGIGLFLFNICGVIVAKAGGFSDFIRSISVIGLAVPMLLCSIFCLSTTQNINAYGGSLALQNIFQGTKLEGNISHKVTVYLIAGFASALSVSGITNYLIPIVSLFSIVMVPFPGMLLAEGFFFHDNTKEHCFQQHSIAIWLTSCTAGFLFLQVGLPIAPLWEMIFSGVCYVIVNKYSS
ncbi:MAG: cytosine permease [Lachnospiraceae bacterium]